MNRKNIRNIEEKSFFESASVKELILADTELTKTKKFFEE